MAAADTPTFGERAFVALQYLLPQHLLSRIVWRATRCETTWWKNALIGYFLRHFAVNMAEAAESDPFAYPSFNHFFTRALRAGARTVAQEPFCIVSPVDGIVSAAGAIEGDRLFQAKGHGYTLDQLLGDAALARRFKDGWYSTLYLAPHNYHRVHMPLAGALAATVHVPGRLFSVNTTTTAQVPRLFARNERVLCLFETDSGPLAVILVGALFVGSMSTVWAGEITPHRDARLSELAAKGSAIRLERGAEMGRFNMGSTVILLLGSGVQWAPALVAGNPVRVGESIGRLSPGHSARRTGAV